MQSNSLGNASYGTQREVRYPHTSQKEVRSHRNGTRSSNRSYSESSGTRSHHSTNSRGYSRHRSPPSDTSYRETTYGNYEWFFLS